MDDALFKCTNIPHLLGNCALGHLALEESAFGGDIAVDLES